MALATRPKPNTADRKRQAQHHYQGKDYLKTYWPYLPMLVIVGTGAVINQALYSFHPRAIDMVSTSSLASTRIGYFTNQTSWSLAAIIAITALAALVFAASHWYRVRRVLNRGEKFAVRHPLLDISLVLILTAGVILTRTIA
jgi:uncharacterized membrane protein YidH (DUF202 family)